MPHGIQGGVRGARKAQKSIFSSLETITIESGVVDLVGRYQLGVKFMIFWFFLIFLFKKLTQLWEISLTLTQHLNTNGVLRCRELSSFLLVGHDGGAPRAIIFGGGDGQKPQKSIFSDFESITIESGVVDLVGRYQLGVKFMNFWIFSTFLFKKLWFLKFRTTLDRL